MKRALLNLINQMDDIKKKFTKDSDGRDSIYTEPDFLIWKQEIQLELQDIYDRKKDDFIWDTLIILKQGFNGWNDKECFNKLVGSLLAIKKNINRYYEQELVDGEQNRDILEIGENKVMEEKSPKIFISHSSEDKEYVLRLVDLMEDIGLSESDVFCSSVPGYGVPLGEDIYEYLKKEFKEHKLHIIFLLSNNYYDSVACMNEMGAAWILQNKYDTILLPGYEFKDVKGAINPRQIGLKLDGVVDEMKEKLGQLKDKIIQEFGLDPINSNRWERKRDSFISSITEITDKDKCKGMSCISEDAIKILREAAKDHCGRIFKIRSLGGTSISAGNTEFLSSQEQREIAKWESVLGELIQFEFIKNTDTKGEVFTVTDAGYNFIEQLYH